MENLKDGRYFSNATNKEYVLEKNLLHPLCKGSLDIRRYHIGNITKSILFPYKIIDGQAHLIDAQELENDFPHIWSYLLECREILESRERGKWKNSRWCAFGRSQNLNAMEQMKIMTPSIANSASFTIDKTGVYYFVGSGGGGGGGYGITLKEDVGVSYEYILGLLNSKLIDMYLKTISSRFSHGYFAYNRQYIEQLPIKTINFKDKKEKEKHDKIVDLVNNVLKFQNRFLKMKSPTEITIIKRQIDAINNQIDRIVYDLYNLSSEEIKIIEKTLA